MGEMVVYFARMYGATCEDEIQQKFGAPDSFAGPRAAPLGRDTRIRARMHQRLQGAGHEAVVDEDILLDIQRGVSAFEIAGAIIPDAMAQDQVLRARRSADRIGLHETEALQCALQR